LVDRGDLIRTRKGRISLPERLGLVAGTVSIGRRGKAVVIADDGDVPISLPHAGVRPAMHGDRVLVAVEPYRRRGLRTGSIQKIIERKTTILVGASKMPASTSGRCSFRRAGTPATSELSRKAASKRDPAKSLRAPSSNTDSVEGARGPRRARARPLRHAAR